MWWMFGQTRRPRDVSCARHSTAFVTRGFRLAHDIIVNQRNTCTLLPTGCRPPPACFLSLFGSATFSACTNTSVGTTFLAGTQALTFAMAAVIDDGMAMTTTEEVAPKRMITILSQDKEEFVVEKGVATMATLIEDLLSDVSDGEDKIPLQNVDARILAKVIEYMKYHFKLIETPQPEDEVRRWDREFVRVDKSTLFHLVLAANYLNIQSLLDLTTQTVAELIKGKTPEQIRTEFGIVNDFTPEEEEEIRRDNAWSEDR